MENSIDYNTFQSSIPQSQKNFISTRLIDNVVPGASDSQQPVFQLEYMQNVKSNQPVEIHKVVNCSGKTMAE